MTESGEEIQTFIPTMTHDAIDSHPVAEETIRRLNLDMTSAELLDNLTIEQVENTSFIVLTYEDTDPARATYIANTVGEVSSELISDGVQISVWEKASLPTTPVSPHPLRNGLLTLVIGLVLCVGVVLALPGVAASVAGKLGRPIVLQGASQAAVLGEALDRRGKLTAVEAALESSLSVEEAERMLEALAAKGHLEVTVEHSRLYYALWGDRGEDGA